MKEREREIERGEEKKGREQEGGIESRKEEEYRERE